MLKEILKLQGVQSLNKKALKQVNGGYGCQCGGYPNAGGNEQGNGEGGQCHEC